MHYVSPSLPGGLRCAIRSYAATETKLRCALAPPNSLRFIYGAPKQDAARVFTVHILGIPAIPLHDADNRDVLRDTSFPTSHRKHGQQTVSVKGC